MSEDSLNYRQENENSEPKIEECLRPKYPFRYDLLMRLYREHHETQADAYGEAITDIII